MKNKPDIQAVAAVVPEAKDLSEVGTGGFKVAYRANIDGKTEALKIVRIPSDQGDQGVRDENQRRIEREIRILRECKTPYLVKLGSISPRTVTIGNEDFVLYSEEFIAGTSLREIIMGGARPALADLVEVGKCLLRAVGELSAKSVIHRDIKPDNVMKTNLPQRPYVLLDLGIAFHVGGTPLTHDTCNIPGTRYYIAPEMLHDGFRQNLDYRADLYTVGLTLYEFASGANPFMRGSDTPFTTLYRIKTVTPKPLAQLRSDLPQGFCSLVDQLIKKMPALRPANIEALLTRVEGIR